RPVAPPATHRAELPEGYRRPAGTQSRFIPFTALWERLEGELAVGFVKDCLPAVGVGEALDDLPPVEEHVRDAPQPRGNFRRPVGYRDGTPGRYAALMRGWPGLP